MKLGTVSLLLLAAILLGGISAHYLLPAKVITKTIEIQAKERIVYRDRTITKTITTKPDGTVIAEEKVADIDSVKTVDTKIAEKLKIIDNTKKLNWGISALAVTDLRRLGILNYGVMLEYRILGPVWLNGFVTNGLSGGVGVGFKF